MQTVRRRVVAKLVIVTYDDALILGQSYVVEYEEQNTRIGWEKLSIDDKQLVLGAGL